MINIPLINDQVVCVDEQAASELTRLHVAFLLVVQDAETIAEVDYNSLAIFALARLKVLTRKRNLEEDGIAFHLRRRVRRTMLVFRILCDLLKARIRAVKVGDGSFLRPTPRARRRLERHLHLSETFELGTQPQRLSPQLTKRGSRKC